MTPARSITRAVCNVFGVTEEQLRHKKPGPLSPHLRAARYCWYSLLHDLPSQGYSSVGRITEKHNTTVRHGVDQAKRFPSIIWQILREEIEDVATAQKAQTVRREPEGLVQETRFAVS
jgi:hypothetical protein